MSAMLLNTHWCFFEVHTEGEWQTCLPCGTTEQLQVREFLAGYEQLQLNTDASVWSTQTGSVPSCMDSGWLHVLLIV